MTRAKRPGVSRVLRRRSFCCSPLLLYSRAVSPLSSPDARCLPISVLALSREAAPQLPSYRRRRRCLPLVSCSRCFWNAHTDTQTLIGTFAFERPETEGCSCHILTQLLTGGRQTRLHFVHFVSSFGAISAVQFFFFACVILLPPLSLLHHGSSASMSHQPLQNG